MSVDSIDHQWEESTTWRVVNATDGSCIMLRGTNREVFKILVYENENRKQMS